MNVNIIITSPEHVRYAPEICRLIDESARQRGAGIARRSESYVAEKISAGRAVIAFDRERVVGFSYIETWSHKRFVANSGLIIDPAYRNRGLATRVKKEIFDLSRRMFPEAKIFSITTGLAVMKMNTQLGFKPVTFSELTDDPEFWRGCEGCRNYDVLIRNEHRICLCTGLLYAPEKEIPKRLCT